MIQTEDVLKVAISLNLHPNESQVTYVINNYESEQSNDPSGNLELWIENLLYQQDGINKLSKDLYYVVAKYLIDGMDCECTTGVKAISVYEIIESIPKLLCEIETYNEVSSENEIQVWLDNNGYEDKQFNFTEL